MVDLPIEKVSKDKQVQTERKPIALDKPQEVTQQVQIHQGNIGPLTCQLLNQIAATLLRKEKQDEKLIDLLTQLLGAKNVGHR